MKYDVIVVGGGLLGSAVAYHLVRAGVTTLLVDRKEIGDATSAGAGILSPETSARASNEWFSFAIEAVNYYDTFLELLHEDGATETGYARCGKLVLATGPEERSIFEENRDIILKRLEALGPEARNLIHEIDEKEAQRRLPVLGRVSGALYHEQAARVDGRLLRAALRQAAQHQGLTIMEGAAEELVVASDHVTAVRVDGEEITADAVVIAAGAWSARFEEALQIRVAVAPQRGQIVHLNVPDYDTSAWPIMSNMRAYYYVPWADARMVFGATRETGSGFQPHTTVAGVQELMEEILRVTPGLAQASIGEVRVGLRPYSDDTLPMLGASPAVPNAFLATGHGPTGLQLGPYSGKLVADMVLGRPITTDLSAFAPSRFS